jgi:uncharacterized phage protein gp47/JayE
MSCDGLFPPPHARVPLFARDDQEALLAQLVARLPGFVPEWHVGDGDAGWALLAVYARYLEILAQGLNRLPQRSLLAFLDLFGGALVSAQSSRVPLVFSLLPTSPGDVELPARTTVAAKLPPPAPSFLARGDAADPPPAPLFYTAQTVSLAHAQLVAMRSIDPDADCFTDCSSRLQTGFTAFDDHTPVAHVLYIGHDKLFKLTGSAEVVFAIAFAEPARAGRTLVLDWEYLSQDGWLPLQVTEDRTARFTMEGEITLAKCCGPDSKQDAVNGRTSYWIRATLALARPFANIEDTLARTLEVDSPPNWSGKDVLLVDGVARGIVESTDGKLVTLEQAVHLEAGEALAVAGKAGTKIVRAPVTAVLVKFTYPFLAGDSITVDGESTATIMRAGAGRLELDRPLAGAQAGARLFLAVKPPPLRPDGLDPFGPLPMLDVVMARVGVSKNALQADLAFCDAAPLDLGSPCYPFGQQPALFTTFYLASEEAFVLGGAQIVLRFALAKPVAAGGKPLLTWEYFDGQSWRALGVVHDFLDTTASLTTAGLVRFDCPADWVPCAVNGSSKHWLRARLDNGDFGQPMRLEVVVVNGSPVVTSVAATLAPPVVSQLRLDYTYFTAFQLPDACLSYNDFVFRDHGVDVRGYRSPFTPFIPVEDRTRALHFGYSDKLPAGLLSTYVAVGDGAGAQASPSAFVWEYRAAQGWTEMAVLDETNGFATSGMVQWVGAPDAVATPGFGGTLYRIRARLAPGERVEPASLAALWPNAVWGVQGETVQQLALGDSDGNPGQGFRFRPDRVPVLPGETVEVREWTGSGDDWQSAVAGVAGADLRFERDALTGTPSAVWVRWRARPTLYGAARDERAYVLERSAGLLRFGDDRHGRIPPAGARIVASFGTGGGILGNVPAASITELRTGVAYLQGVTNPVAASGGAATELLAAVEARGPQRLRNRDRSVSFEDYEWLAREASPDVARVRCLPLTGPDGRPQRGCVSLLVAPQSSDPQPAPTVELARRVRAFLARHCPATVARRIGIATPRYVAVGVHATVVPLAADDAARVEQRARDACNRFLHPLAGGFDGNGWQFGQSVYLSQIASLLEGVEGIDYCADIHLSVGDALAGERIPVGADGIVAAGMHEVKMVLALPVRRASAGAN